MMNIVLLKKPESESLLNTEVTSEVLASGKVAWSDPYTEVSQTAKLRTDEQELHKRHDHWDE